MLLLTSTPFILNYSKCGIFHHHNSVCIDSYFYDVISYRWTLGQDRVQIDFNNKYKFLWKFPLEDVEHLQGMQADIVVCLAYRSN